METFQCICLNCLSTWEGKRGAHFYPIHIPHIGFHLKIHLLDFYNLFVWFLKSICQNFTWEGKQGILLFPIHILQIDFHFKTYLLNFLNFWIHFSKLSFYLRREADAFPLSPPSISPILTSICSYDISCKNIWNSHILFWQIQC